MMRNGPVTMSREEFVTHLHWLIDRIEADDSFEGSLEYRWSERPGMYDVHGALRFGNSMGQGSMRLIGEMVEVEEDPMPEASVDAG